MSIKCSSFRCRALQDAGETCAVQWSCGPGPCALGLARRPKSGYPQRVGHLGPADSAEVLDINVEHKMMSMKDLVAMGASMSCSLGRSEFVGTCRGEICLGEKSRKLRGIVAHLIHGCDLEGQATPSSFATCKGYPLALKCLLVGLNSEDAFGAVRSSRPFTSLMLAFGPLDPCESWPLDQSNDPDLSGVHLSCTGASTADFLYIGKWRDFQNISVFPTSQDPPSSLPSQLLSTSHNSFLPLIFRISSLFVGFYHLVVYQTTSVMAEEQAPASTSNVDGDDYAWKAAFEMTAAYLGFMPTIALFFHAFHLQRSRPKGDAANKFGWVSLKQSMKLFEMFLESVRGFKDSYFFVKPLNSVSWQSLIYQGPAKDATGAPLIGPDGRPVLEDYSRFPLSWRKSHYLKPASDFIYSAEELTVEELSNYEQMKVFVSGFPRKRYGDEEGNPVLDEMGVPVTKKTFIDTRKLLASKSVAGMEACFQEMSTVAAKLRKSKAAKEKSQAAALGSFPWGDHVDNARANAVVVDLDDAAVNVKDQPRPAKVARVEPVNATASGRGHPSSPRFVLPPAIGSPDLVRKSPVALSDAEQAIMNDMGPEALKNELADAMVAAFKLMEISSFLNGRECKYKLQTGLVTQLTEKEKEAARLAEEKAVLEGQVKDLIGEKETLEGKVRDLESRPCSSGTAPDADELVVDPNGEYKGFTRAALVSRIFELEGKELDVAKSSFDNAVAQLMVLNPGVELIVEGASELKEVQDGAIVSPSPDEED
ncbi:hypothetical protein TSUD_147540 [Trifolium subterraneum]|uniref:Uncharacterized protein n=1 Tax=Trifolium subterraneum TaxID=3900 RepID=A0A2Z6N392_TRISU|nr:hypothetical protein TSUD_147540 [Trifolium subterraneum]